MEKMKIAARRRFSGVEVSILEDLEEKRPQGVDKTQRLVGIEEVAKPSCHLQRADLSRLHNALLLAQWGGEVGYSLRWHPGVLVSMRYHGPASSMV
jgi:hypothetical protein